MKYYIVGIAMLAHSISAASVLETKGSDVVSIPNPSFEQPSGQTGSPRGWEFQGATDALEAAWTQETPFEGLRALRIDARRGSHRWQSKIVPLPPHRKYLLTWQTRFHGEKQWRFRATFCGVEIIFKDEEGRSLQTVRQHSNCWQTPGWRPAWLALTVPDEARSLVIRFGIETDVPLPGGFDVDSVELLRWPRASAIEGHSRLTLRIQDERGRPTASRIRILTSQGKSVRATGSIDYRIGGGAFHPLDEGMCQLFVPPDAYAITITKGFEYWPWQKAVLVGQDDTTVEVKLKRAWHWPHRGWYCGDHQAHLYRHGGSLFPMLTWRDVMRVARSEGLDYSPFMGADQYPLLTKTIATELQRPDFVAELTDEITDDLWGHVCPIGVQAEAREDSRYDVGPMNFDRDAAIADAGVLCYAHPYGRLSDDDELTNIADSRSGHLAREFPIDLALGMPCGFDLLTMEGNRNQLERKLRDVYRLYNLGFRPSLTASTDFHVDQARQPIGVVRTYVRSDSLKLPAIATAYRAGRTFATNGPLVDFQVDKAAPGDEITLPDAEQSVRVNVEAVSIGRLERVDIIANGRVVHTFSTTEAHRIAGTVSLPVRDSLWIAAKVVGPVDPHLASELEGRQLGAGQIAHTSPVYILVDGRPILAGTKQDAHYFVSWCDAALQAWKVHLLDNLSTAENDRLVRERIERAKGVFLELASQL